MVYWRLRGYHEGAAVVLQVLREVVDNVGISVYWWECSLSTQRDRPRAAAAAADKVGRRCLCHWELLRRGRH